MFRKSVLAPLFRHRLGRCVSVNLQGVNFSTRKTHSVLLSHSEYDPPNPGREDGPPVLITHGLLGSRQNWNSISKAIARALNRKVISFDARNHGDSPHTSKFSYTLMADDIFNLVEHLAIDQFTLMGHSMGGRTVMTFALKYPDMVDKLVVVDVSPLELNADHSTMSVYVQALREIENRFKDATNTLSEMRKIADYALQAIVIDPAVRAFLLTNLAVQDGKVIWKPNLQGLLDNFTEIGKFPQELLQNVYDEPTLFIRGQRSLYIPVGDFPRIQKTFPKAVLGTVPNAGHWPHSENTITFMDILLPFLANKTDANR